MAKDNKKKTVEFNDEMRKRNEKETNMREKDREELDKLCMAHYADIQKSIAPILDKYSLTFSIDQVKIQVNRVLLELRMLNNVSQAAVFASPLKEDIPKPKKK